MDVDQLAAVEAATLEPQALEVDGSLLVEFA